MPNNVDFSTLTVTGSAQNLATTCSPIMPAGAKGAIMTLDTAPIRFRDDTTDASATVGHQMNVGDVLTFDSWTVEKQDWQTVMARLTVKRTGDTSGVLNISWYD